MNTTENRLVDFLSDTKFENIPGDAIETARKCIVDTLAVTVAGSSGDDIDRLVDFLAGSGGPAQATALVHGVRLSVVHATWANAAMARAFEFDDSHDPSGEHLSVPLLAAALATAEFVGPIDGRRFLTAYVLAAEIVPRLRLARQHNVGPFMSNTFAPFTAAAVSALLLGLKGRAMYNALGWAYAQCAGAVQLQQGGGSGLHTHHGLAAATGVQAALLARAELPGTENFLTGKFGFYNAYDVGSKTDLAAIVDGLGQRFEIVRTCVKQYPAGRVIHGPVEAAIQLHSEEHFEPNDIERVEVAYSPSGYRMTCEPQEERRTPNVGQHARFSLYYNVACALIRGHVDIGDTTPEALADDSIKALTKKIDVFFPEGPPQLIPRGDVTVVLKGGQRLRRVVGVLKGTPDNPIAFDDCADKLRRCAVFASAPVTLAVTETAITNIRHLEDMSDVGELARLFGQR